MTGSYAVDPAIPEAARESKFWIYFRVALSALGLLAVLLGTLLELKSSLESSSRGGRLASQQASPRPPPRVGPYTTRTFFESPEVHGLATDNLLEVGHRCFGLGLDVEREEDRELVSQVVADSFTNMSRMITSPATALLEEEEKVALLRALELLSHPRVELVGLDIARRMAGVSPESQEEEKVAAAAWESLKSRRANPREANILKEELASTSMAQALQSLRRGHRWSLALDPSNLHAARSVRGRWEPKITADSSSPHSTGGAFVTQRLRTAAGFAPLLPRKRYQIAPDMPEKLVGILGGVLEQARFILDVVNPELRGTFLEDFAGSVGADSRLQVLCDAEATSMRLLDAIACPLKFGALGMDVLM